MVSGAGKCEEEESDDEYWSESYRTRILRNNHEKRPGGWHRRCLSIAVAIVILVLVTALSLYDRQQEESRYLITVQQNQKLLQCQESCRMAVVESIPEGLVFNGSLPHVTTYDSWIQLLSLAEKEIDIGSFYWSLQGKEVDHPSAAQGKDIFKRLMKAGLESKIKIRIAQNIDTHSFPNYDTHDLEDTGAAEIRRLNFTRLLGSGILHTKFWIVDSTHVYIGSANLDWRSLTQVKELGLLVQNCTCFAEDIAKIFEAYWILGQNDSQIPSEWPADLDTKFGKNNPMNIAFNGIPYESYLASSPPPFCPEGRTNDIDSILDVIDKAEKFIHVSLYEYFPLIMYLPHTRYWPIIDDKLRSAAIDRKVKIKLLMSKHKHLNPAELFFLKSLQELNHVYPHVDIQIRLFEVPSTPDQAKIPFARLVHNKYMVTDRSAYIGTSNWSGDYFIYTAGVGVIVSPKQNMTSDEVDVRQQVEDIFSRDWNSSYTSLL